MMNREFKYHKPLVVTKPIFSAIIQKLMKKIYWVFVEGTRVKKTSGLAYKNSRQNISQKLGTTHVHLQIRCAICYSNSAEKLSVMFIAGNISRAKQPKGDAKASSTRLYSLLYSQFVPSFESWSTVT